MVGIGWVERNLFANRRGEQRLEIERLGETMRHTYLPSARPGCAPHLANRRIVSGAAQSSNSPPCLVTTAHFRTLQAAYGTVTSVLPGLAGP
jgi:hypothetical protein